MSLTREGETPEMITGMSLIMPDGRVVPIAEDGSYNITEDDQEAAAADYIEDMFKMKQSEDPNKYDQFVEKVVCFKCRLCKYLCESREELIEHLQEKHEDDISNVDENKNDELVPENDITGLSFVLNDTDKSSLNPSFSSNVKSVIIQREDSTANQHQEDIIDNGSDDKGGFLCGGCSKCFDSEQQISEHLSTSLSCSTFAGDSKQIKETNGKHALSDDTLVDRKIKVKDKKFLRRSVTNRNKLEADWESRTLRCSVKPCSSMFKSPENQKYHVSCHSLENTDFNCGECDEKFEKWRECASHLWKVHGIDCDMLLCGVCKNYRTMDPRILETHCQTHENLKLFKCDVCSKRFNQLSQLRNHVVTHMDKTIAEIPSWAKPKQCDICQKIFSDSKSLKKHVQAIHSKLKPYICNVCNHKSARKAMLQLHMRQHTGDKPYSCDLCDYKTGDHNSLRRHKRRHTGVKPYKCPYCPYAAIQSSSFKSHVKSKHPDQPEIDLKGLKELSTKLENSAKEQQIEEMSSASKIAASDFLILVDVNMPKM